METSASSIHMNKYVAASNTIESCANLCSSNSECKMFEFCQSSSCTVNKRCKISSGGLLPGDRSGFTWQSCIKNGATYFYQSRPALCPSDDRIQTENDCNQAAIQTDWHSKTKKARTETATDWPGGCYAYDYELYLNKGAGKLNSVTTRQFCKTTSSGQVSNFSVVLLSFLCIFFLVYLL